MKQFVHLHVHSQYSVLDGQASVSGLVDKAIADGMTAIALTDHGNMFGIKEFTNYIKKKNAPIYDLREKIEKLRNENADHPDLKATEEELLQAEKHYIKPIIGCEVYVARNGKENKQSKEDARGWHLILLAKNLIGYKNLIKIVSRAWVDGYYYTPRTDHADLEKYHEGIIACSACLGGEVPSYILKGMVDEAEKSVLWFKQLFGDDYYLEMQRHKPTSPDGAQDTYPKQVEVNQYLVKFAQKHQIKLICTNDVHFIEENDAEAHHHLLCINTGNDLDDRTKMAYTRQEWFKTQSEMEDIFADIPQSLDNTIEIANKVEEYSIDHKPIMPDFKMPEGFTDENDYLRHLTYQGAEKVYPNMTDELRERINFELSVIKNMGFPGYFLIVQDFTTAARTMGVSVGPGRGSAAGSAVAYCLGITKVDPVKYDLLFERFLNPDRISLPDIDIDFDDDGRGQVLHWVEQRYGKEKVAHIVTYGTMAAKMAIKDVARVEKLPLNEANRLAQLIPDKLPDPKDSKKLLKINLKNAIDAVPDLQKAVQSPDPKISNTLKYAQALEGNVRNLGVHACGVIIGRDDISDWVPVCTSDDKGEKLLVTQYEGSVIEDTGLIKMDFLGLKTLSILKEALLNVKQSRGIDVDLDNISLDDEKTYELYSAGNTIGTFQFESPGMQKYLRQLKPSQFEDLIAMNALYRPGPMDNIPDFIDRKQGRKPIQYDIPVMEKYLKDTYGITVYQEQVMLLSRLLANFTRGQSDELRKAMGKKIKAKLDKLKPKFIEGGMKNGHPEEVLLKIWSEWEKFASYAFNKSHATCYSLVAFQTAYLKAHYPAEYMAAVLTRNLNNIADVTKYMDECKAMGLKVLGPDVNESNFLFSVNSAGNVRFGMGAIKGMGMAAAQAIVEERRNKGPFLSVFDFVERVNLSACGRRNMELLIQSGAFDCFEDMTREQYFVPNDRGESFLDVLIRYGSKFQEDKSVIFNSIFGDDMDMVIARPSVPSAPEFSKLFRLNKEKECIGLYLSSHPLDDYYVYLKYACNTDLGKIKALEIKSNVELVFGGIISNVTEMKTKKGDPFARVVIDDYNASCEYTFFPKQYVNFANFIKKDMMLSFKAIYQKKYYSDEMELVITSISLLSEASEKMVKGLRLLVPLTAIDESFVKEFSDYVYRKRGNVSLSVSVYDPETDPVMNVKMSSMAQKMEVGNDFIHFLEKIDGVRIKVEV